MSRKRTDTAPLIDWGEYAWAYNGGLLRPPQPATAPGGLLSAREAASMLGVSLSTFKDTVRAELPSVTIGRRVLFDKEDVLRWRNSRKVAGLSGSQRDAGDEPTSSVSVTLASASNVPRAKAILARLRSRPRTSTPTR